MTKRRSRQGQSLLELARFPSWMSNRGDPFENKIYDLSSNDFPTEMVASGIERDTRNSRFRKTPQDMEIMVPTHRNVNRHCGSLSSYSPPLRYDNRVRDSAITRPPSPTMHVTHTKPWEEWGRESSFVGLKTCHIPLTPFNPFGDEAPFETMTREVHEVENTQTSSSRRPSIQFICTHSKTIVSSISASIHTDFSNNLPADASFNQTEIVTRPLSECTASCAPSTISICFSSVEFDIGTNDKTEKDSQIVNHQVEPCATGMASKPMGSRCEKMRNISRAVGGKCQSLRRAFCISQVH